MTQLSRSDFPLTRPSLPPNTSTRCKRLSGTREVGCPKAVILLEKIGCARSRPKQSVDWLGQVNLTWAAHTLCRTLCGTHGVDWKCCSDLQFDGLNIETRVQVGIVPEDNHSTSMLKSPATTCAVATPTAAESAISRDSQSHRGIRWINGYAASKVRLMK